MTHDELLKEINTIFLYEDEDKNEENPYLNIHFLLHQHRALRAVVELHIPQTVSWATSGNYCDQCSKWNKPDISGLKKWPCPTIQAIEKELN